MQIQKLVQYVFCKVSVGSNFIRILQVFVILIWLRQFITVSLFNIAYLLSTFS
jgi:hypothetical protein